MSRPANILDRFQSHSYHHILIACSTQLALDRVINLTDISDFANLRERQPVFLPTEGVVEDEERIEGGAYNIIINGLIDSRYTVHTASWKTVSSGSIHPQDGSNSFAVEGNLVVKEPRGFEFLNILNSVADDFQSEPTGIIFALKTVFVGHTPDGQNRYITNIPPFTFQLTDIKGKFGIEGGTYAMRVFGTSNGAARMPQYSRVGEGDRLNTSRGDTLRSVMSQLQSKLNDQSNRTFECVRNTLRQRIQDAAGDVPADFRVDEALSKLRKVEYEIVLGNLGTIKDYNEPEYKIDDITPRLSDDGEPNSPGPISWGKSTTVEAIIHSILRRSSQIKRDQTLQKDNTAQAGLTFTHKISSELIFRNAATTPNDESPQSSETETLLVRYTIRPYPVFNNDVIQRILEDEEGVQDSGITSEDIRNNTIEFDYFYTGRNVDIKQFDIKLNYGLMFLQVLRTTDNLATPEQNAQTGIAPTRLVQASDFTYDDLRIRNRTPIFPSTDVKDVLLRNVGDPVQTTNYNAMLSRQASLEQIQTKIVIRGNPYLLSTTNKSDANALPPDGEDVSEQEDQVLRNWWVYPGLAKINIRMPENSETPSGSEQPRLVDFWYKGYYYIFSIEHKFAGGEFTQELNMLSLYNNAPTRTENAVEVICQGEPENEQPETREDEEPRQLSAVARRQARQDLKRNVAGNTQQEPEQPTSGSNVVRNTRARVRARRRSDEE